MCFRLFVGLVIGVAVCSACSQYRKVELVRSGGVRMSMTLPEDEVRDEEVEVDVEIEMGKIGTGEPFLMHAVKDEETGEMVAMDMLSASTVTARFRNVAERAGYVTVGFDINVPAGMADSRFCLKFYPRMVMHEDTVGLEPVIITGTRYREGQLRGYERYRRFLNSIVTDTTDLIWLGQLEIFLQRHFPDTYEMKSDSSFVTDPMAKTLFGATQEEALRHYSKKILRRVNDRRIARKGEMFLKYVRDPIESDGVRLDTVFNAENGDFVYSYLHTFKTRPHLKKVILTMEGSLYAAGEKVADLPKPEDLTFYISTLSSLLDASPRYRTVVIERRAYENTKAFLDFKVGSAEVDTTLGNNASELSRVMKCIEGVVAQTDYILDSLLISASCSPEGSWKYNGILSEKRANAILRLIRNNVPEDLKNSLKTSRIPENWRQLRDLIQTDTFLVIDERKEILRLIDGMVEPDRTEKQLSLRESYPYVKRELYPKLRSVSFDFYLHKVGMVKDTVHTTELDSVYMSGVAALKNLDYVTALNLLKPYGDYNAALACVSSDLNYSALDILQRMDMADPKVCYLLAVVYARLDSPQTALQYYRRSIERDPGLRHRANLDPELSSILKLNN